MSLKVQLLQDMKSAMKEKDTLRKNTIQLVRSAILQEEKDNHVELSDDDVIKIISSQVKKRKSSLPEYEKSGRTDLVDDLKVEINILMSYLPEQLSDEELTSIVEKTIEEVGASSMKDMGKVMSAIIPKVQGKADNKKVSEIIRNILK
ncbi:GatB/YqeY domain-containing protein [Vallitalea guaymasensis]|uniref:GatB/YqeY domain-containing protein n=1 Tax=Vallitalea guaymasensis TaxID=1185412 RepID=A0A8J8SEC2_9FIRM|nr:GatB/YqeY domain-containing protein [Vallitalea guaymasensis]QUH31732.1 GatB/YqeY domain-containing protein [Vallitalea guaymasensis]